MCREVQTCWPERGDGESKSLTRWSARLCMAGTTTDCLKRWRWCRLNRSYRDPNVLKEMLEIHLILCRVYKQLLIKQILMSLNVLKQRKNLVGLPLLSLAILLITMSLLSAQPLCGPAHRPDAATQPKPRSAAELGG